MRTPAVAAGLDDLERALRHGKSVERLDFKPRCIAGIAAGAQCPFMNAAEEVDQDVVVFEAAEVVGDDALEDGCDGVSGDAQAGLLPDFANYGLFKAFAGLDAAAGQGPKPGERRIAALNEKHTAASVIFFLQDNRPDTQHRPHGVAPAGAD